MTKQPLSDFLKWIEECIAGEEKGTYAKYKSVDECREHILQVGYEFLFPEEYAEANSWKVKMTQDLLKATAYIETTDNEYNVYSQGEDGKTYVTGDLTNKDHD